MEDLPKAARWLRSAKEIVAFTGAGVSAESGIPTFRDDDGFWREFPPEQFATWSGLVTAALIRPRLLAEFIHAVIDPIASATPNAAHAALAALEERIPVTVVTQNIDGLHQSAGSTTVLEIHGSILDIITWKGKPIEHISRADLHRMSTALDRCRGGWFVLPRVLWSIRRLFRPGLLRTRRPNLVLFGDAMAEPAWTRAQDAVGKCECMLQVGTSGTVWPAAMLPGQARAAGARIITVDPNWGEGDVWLEGPAGTVVPRLVEEAFRDRS
jgi:NAD-dependent deacetylase